MRISDWSSDVYSSDLLAMRVSDMAFASGRGWKIRGHDGASRTFDLVIVAAGPWSGEIAAKLGYDVPMFWERRSEEHTSELQSLMRISYAVICLKKTKKKDISAK